MNNSIADTYNDLLNKGVSVLSLYIYSLLVNDERTFEMSESDLESTIDEIINRYYDYAKSLTDTIEDVLDNADDAWNY